MELQQQEWNEVYDYIPKWKNPSYGVNPGEARYSYRELDLEQENILALGFFRYLYNVTHVQKLSLLILTDGRHRSGKSMFWVTAGCILDKNFEKNMEKRVCYDADQFLDLVQEINDNKIPFPVILVDEAGNTLNAADWYEKMQKAIVKALTVIGYLHPTIIFITTNRALLLAGVRKQAHLYVHLKPDKSRKFSRVMPYHIVWNPLKMEDKPRYKKLRISMYGRRIALDCVKVPMPPKSIADRYATLENKMKPKILAELIDDVTKSKIKKTKAFFDMQSALDQVLKHPQVFGMKNIKNTKRMDETIIRMRFKCPNREALALKKMAEQVMNDEVKKEVFFREIPESENGKG
jgi:hypothetical protein